MSKYMFAMLTIALFSCSLAEAQVRIFVGPGTGIGPYYGPGYGRPYKNRRMERRPAIDPAFKPTLNLSIGYGLPNLDKVQLAEFYNYYKGNTNQSGPVTGALDYQFSRSMSVGLMVTHGKVSVPYYSYNDSSGPSFTGSVSNWSFMLNFVRYMPLNSKISPYFRTAIGVNSWKQDYSDIAGNKMDFGTTPSELAYQVGLGAKFNVASNAGFFLEAGYGKYILQGGLAFKF